MSLWQDRQERVFFWQISGCCLGLLLVFAALFWQQGDLVKDVLLEKAQAEGSYLLEQGVAPEIIAGAWKNTAVTTEGRSLVEESGRTAGTKFYYIPEIMEGLLARGGVFFAAALLPTGLLIGFVLRDFRHRRKLYETGISVVEAYLQGDFGRRLSRNEEGVLQRFLASVDSLATALQAKGETEHRTKEFLKDTVSDISHQLKTPLAALQMYLEIILEEPDNREAVKCFGEKAVQSVTRMQQLIAALLKMMRLDAGSIVFEKQTCTILEVAEYAVGELRTRAAREQKRLRIEGDGRAQMVCDFAWTAEALGNLVKNALDHTKAGDEICICWQSLPLMQQITVADNGEGILPEDIYHIFKRFYRSQNSGDRQGAGLGLSLAKAIAEGQGGSLSVRSRPGEGTEFAICLRCG